MNLLRHQCTEQPPNKFQKKKQGQPILNTSTKREKLTDCHKKMKSPNKKHINQQVDRCHKCGDTPHNEGLRCPTSRQQCKHCNKIGHFSHICFKKKQESIYKKGSGNPKAYQLKIGRYSTEDFLYKQDGTDVSKSEDSFCLQMQIKKPQADQESCETQHLVTNLHHKVKPHGKRTKFLIARIDTCSNTNVMLAYTRCCIMILIAQSC